MLLHQTSFKSYFNATKSQISTQTCFSHRRLDVWPYFVKLHDSSVRSLKWHFSSQVSLNLMKHSTICFKKDTFDCMRTSNSSLSSVMSYCPEHHPEQIMQHCSSTLQSSNFMPPVSAPQLKHFKCRIMFDCVKCASWAKSRNSAQKGL